MRYSVASTVDRVDVGVDELAWFNVDQGEGCVVVRAGGEIDVATSPRLGEVMDVAAQFSNRIIVDLAEVNFLDSTGLQTLVQARHRAQRGGVVVLTGPGGIVRTALHVTGLDQVFTIYDHLEDGVCALRSTTQIGFITGVKRRR